MRGSHEDHRGNDHDPYGDPRGKHSGSSARGIGMHGGAGNNKKNLKISLYFTCAIINCGLYIFYPIFEDHFFVFEEVFSENSVLMYD